MSANNYTGVVASVQKNDAGYWSIKTADGQWFGTGKMKPACSEGDEVAFDFSMNGKYSNADLDTLEVLSSDNKVPAKKAWSGKKNASGEGAGKSDYWEAKEKRDISTQKEIRFQASRNAAIEAMGVALANGIISIPEGKKEGDKMKVFLTYVDKVTDRFNSATLAVHEAEAVAVPAATKPKAVAKAKVVEEEPEVVEDELNDDISFI
jgi:hypothetical protein